MRVLFGRDGTVFVKPVVRDQPLLEGLGHHAPFGTDVSRHPQCCHLLVAESTAHCEGDDHGDQQHDSDTDDQKNQTEAGSRCLWSGRHISQSAFTTPQQPENANGTLHR